jgi:hypothetical protein
MSFPSVTQSIQEVLLRRIILSLASAAITTVALAQVTTDKKPGDSPHSTGRTEMPQEKGQMQPQGPTGPINTGVGGAPASSPQGQTPPGMQSAPGGSSETIVSPPDPRK